MDDRAGERPQEGRPIRLTLTSGEQIEVHPISLDLVNQLDLEFPEPEVPMAEIKTADGAVERVPNPEDEEYKAEVERVTSAKAEAILRLVCLQGFPHIKVSFEDPWVEEMRYIRTNWEPPKSLAALKVEYLRFWLITSRIDWEVVIHAALRASVISPEEVERQLRSFRDQIQRRIGPAVSQAISREFDLQHGAGRAASSTVVGDVSSGMEQPKPMGPSPDDCSEKSSRPD